MATLLYGSLHSAPPGGQGEFNLNGYRAIFSAQNVDILLNTFGIAFVKTILAMSLAVFLAWIVARTDTPMSRTLEILISLPFFIPPFLTAMAWGLLGDAKVGTINIFLTWLFGPWAAIVNVYSWGGIVWHMMQYSTPFLFLFIVEAFRAMDPSLEEASRMSGANKWYTLRRVTLTLMLPTISSAFILSFIRGIEAFESALIFGSQSHVTVLTTEIYNAINHRTSPDYQYATALAVFGMLMLLLLVIGQWRLLGDRSFVTVTGKNYSAAVSKLGKWRWVTFSIAILFFLLTVGLPIGQLVVGSFFKFFGFYSWKMLTLDHYRAIWGNDTFWRGFYNTGLLGLLGATLTMVLGACVAYVSVRTRWRGRRLIEILAWLPWMMPGVVLGVGYLWAFALLPAAIPLYGTVWALLLAYIALGTPLAVKVMSSAFAQLSYDLEESSRVHGATWLQTAYKILIALSWPSFAVGWVIVFFGILRELSASVLLYSAGSEVMSVVMMGLWQEGKAEQVCVIGTLMIVLVLLFRWVQQSFLNRAIRSV
jgi:iron(III) transport system permease protein